MLESVNWNEKYTIKHLCKTYFLNYMYRVQNSIYKKKVLKVMVVGWQHHV